MAVNPPNKTRGNCHARQRLHKTCINASRGHRACDLRQEGTHQRRQRRHHATFFGAHSGERPAHDRGAGDNARAHERPRGIPALRRSGAVLYIAGTTFQSLDGSEDKRTARAYVAKAHVETTGDELPFDDATSLGYLLDYVVELVGRASATPRRRKPAFADRMGAAYAGRSAGNANPERQE